MTDLAREKRIIDRVEAIYNKRRDDFASVDDWNNFLEEKESIIFNLVENIDVPATEAKLKAYQRTHERDIMSRHVAHMQAAQQAAAPPETLADTNKDGGVTGGVAGALFAEMTAHAIMPEVETEAPSPYHDAQLTDEQRVAKERRAWMAGGWTEQVARDRYIHSALSSMFVI